MSELNEITDLERAYFELEKIKRQVNTLSDFLSARLRHNQPRKPKTIGMRDPRTGNRFNRKKSHGLRTSSNE
jgi:hypothetical protein